MNRQQATRLVDRWSADWILYLDGKLHRLPRHALIEAIVAASVTEADADDASEDLEGRPMTDDGVKAVMREVHQEDEAKRKRGADARQAEAAAEAQRRADEVQEGPDQAEDAAPAAAPGAADQAAAADALALLQDVAREDRRPLMLTPSQAERFNRFGLLAGVDYVVDEPMPVETMPVEPKRKPGRPPRHR